MKDLCESTGMKVEDRVVYVFATCRTSPCRSIVLYVPSNESESKSVPRSKADIAMFVLDTINSACCQGRRRGGSEPCSDPRSVLDNCTGLVGTWQLRRRFQVHMPLTLGAR
jgi:hypothetical protein